MCHWPRHYESNLFQDCLIRVRKYQLSSTKSADQSFPEFAETRQLIRLFHTLNKSPFFNMVDTFCIWESLF